MRRHDPTVTDLLLQQLALPELAPLLRRWLFRQHELLSLDPSLPGLPAWIAQREPIRHIIRHALALAPDSPCGAATLAELAAMLVRRARARVYRRSARWLQLEADTFFELACILKKCNHLRRARRAALHAKALYRSRRLPRTSNGLRVDMILGEILFHQGHHDEAFATVENATRRFDEEWHDRGAVARAKTLYGGLLITMKAYERAMPYFHDSIRTGGELLDDYTVASNLYNYAICAAELGLANAEESLATARAKYEELGCEEALLHCDSLRATMLRRQGRASEAISEAYKVRDAFSAMGLPKTAARLTREIAEWLFEEKRFSEIPLAAKGWRNQLVDGALTEELAILDDLVARSSAA